MKVEGNARDGVAGEGRAVTVLVSGKDLLSV